ncbi:MAG: phosphate ABC transporter permease subunit PstC [Tahibacter sp.]
MRAFLADAGFSVVDPFLMSISQSLPGNNLSVSRSREERRGRRDAIADRSFQIVVAAAGIFVLAALVGAAASMLWGGSEAISTFGWRFFFSDNWNVGGRQFGALVQIYGTIVTAVIALLIAVPVSFGIALFLTEVAPPWLRTPIGSAIELLAGIPSIIYGMWGLFVLAPVLSEHVYPWMNDHLGPLPGIGRLFQGPPLGIGMLTAGIVLAVMVIPFISSVMRDVFLAVPTRLKESAHALGSTTWEVVWDVVLPYTRSAVVGGIFLGLGRALGETMAVTFVIGNAYNISASLLEPGTSIASAIANEFAEALDPLHKSALLALGFVLFLLTFVVLVIARLMLKRLKHREGN